MISVSYGNPTHKQNNMQIYERIRTTKNQKETDICPKPSGIIEKEKNTNIYHIKYIIIHTIYQI